MVSVGVCDTPGHSHALYAEPSTAGARFIVKVWIDWSDVAAGRYRSRTYHATREEAQAAYSRWHSAPIAELVEIGRGVLAAHGIPHPAMRAA